MTLLCIAPHCGIHNRHTDQCDDDACRGCLPRRAADGLLLCDRDTERLADDAWQAAELYDDLLLAALGTRQGEKTSGSRNPGLDPGAERMEARSSIRATLVSLCRVVAEERGITLPADSVQGMARFIGKHSLWLAAHHAADEHAHDLRDIASDPRTWRLAYPTSSDALYIGECPLHVTTPEGDREVCGTRLRQRCDEPLITCPGCGTRETVEQWQRWIVGNHDGVVDAYAAAAHLAVRWHRPVDPATVRKWGQRTNTTGVEPLSEPDPTDPDRRRLIRDQKGRTLYPLTALVAYAERTWGPAPTALRRVASRPARRFDVPADHAVS